MNKRQVLLFSRFERFWHWSQMLFIFTLLFTGFNIHGFYNLLDFKTAVILHTLAAVMIGLLWILAIFWHLTTGTWRHYIPTTNGLWRVIRFYSYGIFKGEHHPYRKAFWRKHNPLQALTYLALNLILLPAIWISGLVYLFASAWQGSGDSLALVAFVHTGAAFAICIFIIVHVYLMTVGHSFIEHIMPMINGFDEVDLSPEQEAYLEQNIPNQIR